MTPLRILVVDDHEEIRKGIKALLSAHTRWSICGEAQDGIEGVEKALNLKPDVILMDVSMPRMGGMEATGILRREIPNSDVVILSQNDRTIVSRQARDAGASAFVAKSDLARDLISTLDTVAETRNVAATKTDGSMTESTESPMGIGAYKPSGEGTVPVESILCTEELQRRPPRPADYQKENTALSALAQSLADSPHTILQTLADTLLDVCAAGSAGISLLTEDDGKRFYWPAIAGEWKPHIGGGTPRDFGPCGDVLDRNRTLLFSHVERRYTYFQPVQPLVEEALLVPFYVAGKAVGTIWAVAHNPDRKFDAEDERMMNSLGKFASSAYQVVSTLDALKTQESERQKDAHANSLLAAIVDSSEDAIVSKTLDGVITSWNRGAEHLFGYPAQEAIGRNIMLVIPADRKQEEAGILRRIRQGERIEHFETLRLKKDGTLIDLSLTISPVKDATGRIVGASKVARDISERKHAEEATNLLAAIVDSSDDAITSKSLSGVITSWNKGAERLLGYSAGEAVGQHIFLIIPDDRRDEEITILDKLKRGERVNHFETVRRRKDGTMIDLSLTISPVKDATGKVIGASKVARDITESKRIEQALRESEERLRKLSDDLEGKVQVRTRQLQRRNAEVLDQAGQLRELSGRLLKTQDDERRHIARELHDSAGQLISALGMNLAGINQHAGDNPTLAKALDDTQNLLQQLNKEIRTTSYLLHPPLLDDNGLRHAIDWYMEGLSERSDLKIDLDVSENFGRLPEDLELAIFRIVQEALTNIHRHSGSKTGTIRLSRDNGRVLLEIQDHGRGISVEKLAAIKAQRTGVGIAGMRERVLHLKGEMDIQSNDGGALISVTLPLDPRSASATLPEAKSV
jgi:PAS domain S-box-containing protein